jgi:hypothetical protein
MHTKLTARIEQPNWLNRNWTSRASALLILKALDMQALGGTAIRVLAQSRRLPFMTEYYTANGFQTAVMIEDELVEEELSLYTLLALCMAQCEFGCLPHAICGQD